MEKLVNGQHVFEIVESVPRGYKIWNIGKNMTDGYLPLCELYEGTYRVKTDTLKAIKVEGAQTILAAIGYGPETIAQMERYIKRYENSKKAYTRARIEKMKKAVEVMKTLNWD